MSRTIYLMHPRHGTKVATAEMEALADEVNGWVRFNPHEPVATDPLEDLEVTSPDVTSPDVTSPDVAVGGAPEALAQHMPKPVKQGLYVPPKHSGGYRK